MASQKKKLYLTIRTRRGVMYDGEVQSITSFNDKGEFDVLREHTQFISIIKNRVVITQLDGEEREFPVDNAIMRVKREYVEVFLGVKQ